ncbi:MAG: hypothetical protein NZM11_00460 [Anaerolineales bacterium]|nr:hypothetical protein [Anaerolineales bacterium]
MEQDALGELVRVSMLNFCAGRYVLYDLSRALPARSAAPKKKWRRPNCATLNTIKAY